MNAEMRALWGWWWWIRMWLVRARTAWRGTLAHRVIARWPLSSGRRVRVVAKDETSYFHNALGVVTRVYPLTGSDAGCGDVTVVQLDETGYELHICIFTTLRIVGAED